MKKYIEKIEKLVKQKMTEKPKKKEKQKEQKGFMARKMSDTPDQENSKQSTDLMEVVADAIIQIRKKRMGIKDGTTV